MYLSIKIWHHHHHNHQCAEVSNILKVLVGKTVRNEAPAIKSIELSYFYFPIHMFLLYPLYIITFVVANLNLNLLKHFIIFSVFVRRLKHRQFRKVLSFGSVNMIPMKMFKILSNVWFSQIFDPKFCDVFSQHFVMLINIIFEI